MILCLDIGNSHIYGGVFEAENLLMRFRYPSTSPCTSDQLGVFFKNVLRENNINIQHIQKIAVSSVVPSIDYSVHAAMIKYFNIDPFFLKAEVNTGLIMTDKNPQEIGADRIANAIAVANKFPDKTVIVVDLGTATTFDIVFENKRYISALIIPGMRTTMKALHENTAKLPPVNIIRPTSVMGQTTTANIQSGLYYGHLGSIKEILNRMMTENHLNRQQIKIIGTGGFAHLFEKEKEKIFDVILPDLILHGLRISLLINNTKNNKNFNKKIPEELE